MDACCARLDHGAHELEGVQVAAKSGFSVGNDGRHPVDMVVPRQVGNLIGAQQRVVQAARQVGGAVGWVETLVRIRLAGIVGVTRHLPAAKVDGLEAGLHHLHGLVAGHRPKRRHKGLGLQQVPKALGAAPRQ